MNKFVDTLRSIILLLFTVAACCAGVMRLMKLQLVQGGEYLEKSLSTSEITQEITAPRGQIADYSGELLVSNKSGYNIIAQSAFFPDKDPVRNEVVLGTAKILREDGVEYDDILPISFTTPFAFEEDREADIERLRKDIGVQVYATAYDCIVAMCRKYQIYSRYTAEEVRIIAGLRYTMDRRDFSVSNRFTFSEDVPMETVVRIKENAAVLTGIDVSEEAVRTVNIGDVVPHMIGTVGAISAEEYDELSTLGYNLSDSVGKGGIEYACENTLRGEKGERTFVFIGGQVVSDTVTAQAVPGHSLKLTVDSDFQREVQTILKNHITWLNNQTSSQRAGQNADAGTIVVLNARTGALLAAATQPTYDLLDYIDDYNKVANRDNSPLTNRATMGRYRPGSTFKTVTATAALNEGIISPNTTVDCQHIYTYWDDYKPECTGFHGRLNVVEALRESCNIFFYDVGRIMGIDTITEYASLYGLGEEMGLEIGRGRKIGYIASPETFKERGLDWQAGNVVQAAIGQSDTYVTPLQMAAQAMTIANKGVRYKTFMVDSVYDYSFDTLLTKTRPEIACTIEDKTGYTFDYVTEGMKEAANFREYEGYPKCFQYYTGNYLLKGLPYAAAIKTGTPQMTSKNDTGSSFIGFYPADDPEIAFAGFVEHGEYSKFMIRDIIKAYYQSDYLLPELQVIIDAPAVLSDTQSEPSYEPDVDNYYDDDDEEYYYDDYDDYEEEYYAPVEIEPDYEAIPSEDTKGGDEEPVAEQEEYYPPDEDDNSSDNDSSSSDEPYENDDPGGDTDE
ncbi:MAG: hypothetical protein II936_00285 [Oscillospiraceae bacterium]|nr:hypothetical protein [Oscillospiraceae bacterium]